jgi:hypothetical protein
VSKRLRFSRFRRLPGIYRIGDRKRADADLDSQRLTLYLPLHVLDQAEAQAQRAGCETVQEYCERLLAQAIDTQHANEVVEDTQARRGPLEGLDAISNDVGYLSEWKASQQQDRSVPSKEEPMPSPASEEDDADSGPGEEHAIAIPVRNSEPVVPSDAVRLVLRHAGVEGDDPAAFLPTLRRGEPVGGPAAQELLQALRDLEVEYRSHTRIERRLAYALHRLAFEGQVLLTDAWAAEPFGEATVDVLRIVQESVDRVLSGEDIRYFAPEPGPERFS